MRDYLLETKLRTENRALHRLTKDSAAVLQKMLESFLPRFPDFTDHTILHSMDVLEYCNLLLGEKQIERLTAAECYVLIMSCYLHDIGMGINQKNYEELSQKIDFGDYFETHSRENTEMIIRDFHNEYSGLFIRKYSDLFDIPSDAMTRAIIQVSRGHRKTDLLDRSEFGDIQADGAVIRTAYLSAVMRLADEIDVASDRNPILLFGDKTIRGERSIIEFGLHESILHVDVGDDAVTLQTRPKTAEYRPKIETLADKITDTLSYCRTVAEQTSDLRIRQNRIIVSEL